MQTVIVHPDPINCLPCKNCNQSSDKKWECPECHGELCGGCFIEIPEGDGTTGKCPHANCGTTFKLPTL